MKCIKTYYVAGSVKIRHNRTFLILNIHNLHTQVSAKFQLDMFKTQTLEVTK